MADFPSSLPEPLRSWAHTLRYRPLLWLAASALLGVIWAGYRVGEPAGTDRSNPSLYAPLLIALVCAGAAWCFRNDGFWWRLGCAGAVICVFCTHTERRLVPPAGDIAFLVLNQPVKAGPLDPITVRVEGVVADYPDRSDFNVQFPLDCSAPYSGRVWIKAPYLTHVQAGDQIRTTLSLTLPQRPGSPAERASFWTVVVGGCWVEGKTETLEIVQNRPLGFSWRLDRWVKRIRTSLLAHYEYSFGDRDSAPESSVEEEPRPKTFAQLTAQALTAIVFGQGGLDQPLPAALRQDFRRAGLTHLLVASGTQVSIACAVLLGLARGVGLRRWPVLLALIPVLIAYGLIAGGASSIWRAVLAGALVACALLLGRPVDALSLWSLALLALLAWDPAQAWNLGFQLTFAATFGLIVLAPGVIRIIDYFCGRTTLGNALGISFGAQFATAPFSLYHFGTFGTAGLVANLVAVPLAGFLVVTGSLGLLFGPFNTLNYHLVHFLSWTAHLTAGIPGALWQSEPVGLPSVVLAGSLSLGLFAISPEDAAALRELAKNQIKKFRAQWGTRLSSIFTLPGALIGLAALAAWVTWLYWPRPPVLRMTVLDVGQGESILLQGPGGGNILVDGGTLDDGSRSDIGHAVIVPELERRDIRRLDMMVLTHSDSDHCSGLPVVVREVPVGAFLDGPSGTQQKPEPAATDYLALRREVARFGIPDRKPVPGDRYPLGEATFTVLAPSQPPLPGDNDNAIVAMVEWGKTRLLLTADVEALTEQRLLERGADLHCTVLKVGHHGSKTSTTDAFLKAASPKEAVLSCGKYNPFGHPSAEVLHRLDDAGVPVYRTDVNGSVSFACDNAGNCSAETFR